MSVADLVDRAFEALVVPSFSRLGAVVRGRLDHWSPPPPDALAGKVVVVTGATSGIGLAAAEAFVELGAHVEIVARNPGKAKSVCAELSRRGPGDASWVEADMGDLASVRRAAGELSSRHPAVHALVHNAGALDARHALTEDGLERTAASQVVGPFLLTALLERSLRAAAPARVIWVSSGGMYAEALSVDALTAGPEDYDGIKAYARAKRAQVVLAEMWAERLEGAGVVVHAMHPGWADTPGVARSLPRFRRLMGPLLRSPEAGADTAVWLVADDGAPLASTGGFWLDRRRRSTHRLGSTRGHDTPEERARLWQWCTISTGLGLPVPER